MLIRNPYIRLSIYLLVLLAFGGWLTHLAISKSWFAAIPAMGVIWAGYRVFGLFNRVHNQVAYFFNAIENEDSTLYFPEDIGHKPTKELHRGLNRMNRLIQEVKLSNRMQEQYYEFLLEQVATGIIVVNENGSILQANSAAKRLLHYQWLNHVEQLKRVDEQLFVAVSALVRGKAHQFVKFVFQSHIVQLSLHGASAKDKNETVRIISIHDVGNEMDIKELESWQRLIRVLTHEIMNSMTPIISLSQTLMGYYQGGVEGVDGQMLENTARGLGVIHERSEGLMRFVESYRSLTRIVAPVIKPVDLQQLLDSILLLMQNEPLFQRVSLSLQVESIFLSADEGQLSQVIINLLKNALQAVEAIGQPQISITAQQDAQGHCAIAIHDNGLGIAAEQLDQVFIPFFTTREQGSGIGLSLSRQIVRNHGGRLEVQSQPGSTTFTIRI